MKKQLLILALCAAALAPSAMALTAAQAKAVKRALDSVPVPELPAKAAELVAKASKVDREAVAMAAVRAAIYKNRASATLVVSAIAKSAPDLAGAVSLVAAEMESGQARSIASAAVNAAPGAKTAIAASVDAGVQRSAAASDASFTTRGSAANPHRGANVTHSNRPINPGAHGNGNFWQNPPHGGNPPGHDPDHAGKPDFVDYHKPRRH